MSTIREQLAAKRAEARKNGTAPGTPVRGQSGRTVIGTVEGLEEERTVSGQIRKGVKSGQCHDNSTFALCFLMR